MEILAHNLYTQGSVESELQVLKLAPGTWQDHGPRKSYSYYGGEAWWTPRTGLLHIRCQTEFIKGKDKSSFHAPASWSKLSKLGLAPLLSARKHDRDDWSWPAMAIFAPDEFSNVAIHGNQLPRRQRQEYLAVVMRAKRIRIPKHFPDGVVVVHVFSTSLNYDHFEIVTREEAMNFKNGRVFIDDHINLVDVLATYGVENEAPEPAAQSFRRYFDPGNRWSQSDCDRFFSNDSNFVLPES